MPIRWAALVWCAASLAMVWNAGRKSRLGREMKKKTLIVPPDSHENSEAQTIEMTDDPENPGPDPMALTYDTNRIDMNFPPPVVKFREPEPLPRGRLMLTSEITPNAFFDKSDRDQFEGAFVAGHVKYSVENADTKCPHVTIFYIWVVPDFRREGVAVTMVSELKRMYPNAIFTVEFNQDPAEQVDKGAVLHIMGRFALNGYAEDYPSDDEEEGSSSLPPRYKLTVETELPDGGMKREVMDSRLVVTLGFPIKALKRIQRIVVDCTVRDERKLRPRKELDSDVEDELEGQSKYDITVIPKLAMAAGGGTAPYLIVNEEGFEAMEEEERRRKMEKKRQKSDIIPFRERDKHDYFGTFGRQGPKHLRRIRYDELGDGSAIKKIKKRQ